MNIGALIPIRLASERLPGKSLMKIKGKTMLEHLIERATKCGYLERAKIVVCTTKNEEDDALEEETKRLGIRIFRGSTDDIIDRFKMALDEFKFDYIIQIDGDDPFSEPLYMELCMNELLNDESLDIVYCEGLPLGLSTKAIKSSAVKRVWEHHTSERNDTGFIWYFTKTNLCKCKVLTPISDKHINNEIRLTLDYIEDFNFFDELFNRLYCEDKVFTIEDILDLVKRNPNLMKINNFLNDEYWIRTKEMINLEYKDLEGKDRKVEV